MSKANTRQPGGTHYIRHGASGEQHWDRMWRLVGPAWFIGNITKYAERALEKNGLEDIDKVIHYAQKYRELVAAFLTGTGVPPGAVDLTRLAAQAAPPPPCARKDEEGGGYKVHECCHAETELVLTVVGSGRRCKNCGHTEAN